MSTEQIIVVNNGYLITPAKRETLKELGTGYWNDTHLDHSWGWPEYAFWNLDYVFPSFLDNLAKAGIAFGWECICTEDFSYYAYNFPTEDSKNNMVIYRTGRRKGLPFLSVKNRKIHEGNSVVNEFLDRLGVPNGSS